jgi:aryl-phospho-beta-D-glucosidase BglC (GH1 family)
MGINAIRVPFGYRNLQNADGSWIKNAAGNIDFSRLDWIVDQAAQRGLYTILDFHIWDTQQANYSLISENNDGGHASLAKAQQIWTQVAQHFLGNANVAAYDVINEPTGSWGNLLQDGLYKAVRAVDKDRIIIMESMSADPASLGWQQVVYSIHQYNMMGNDFGANQSAFWGDLNGSIKSFNGFNIPTYIGEFMVQESGETLGWLLGQYNSNQLSWTNWTYKTVNMGAWGLCNLPGSAHVDILNDSYETIQNTWQNLPACSPETAMVNAFKKALGR